MPLTIFTKCSILDVWLNSEYASAKLCENGMISEKEPCTKNEVFH